MRPRTNSQTENLFQPARLPDNSLPLGNKGNQKTLLVYPSRCAESKAAAADLAAAISHQVGSAPDLLGDVDILPHRHSVLPDEVKSRPMILLGNLNNNRLVRTLYARYQCTTDAIYPGRDGYELRSLVNPLGGGANAILIGGSDARGIVAASTRLKDLLPSAVGDHALPFLHEIRLEPGLEKDLRNWPHTPLDTGGLSESKARGLHFYTDLMRTLGSYTLLWSWTGDSRYAEIARDSLRALNDGMDDTYGDWHYLAERALRAIPLLTAGGWLEEADLQRTQALLWQTAFDTATDWWRMRDAGPPLGHRHHGKGTYEFLLLVRYLLDHGHPTDAGRSRCLEWVEECHTFLDALAQARIDDQDDECTLNNLATLYWYALGEERYDFFENGSARMIAERSLALHDNTGAGSGQGGYGEGLPGALYFQQEATVPVAACALYYQDPELKWILHNLPNLNIPQRYGFLHYAPYFIHNFGTGPELATQAPASLTGLQLLPVTDHQFSINQNPPEHIEFSGHLVNAPETWQLGEGIDRNHLPQSRGFDKIVFRGGFGREDSYLLLQGYQGGYRWQGHMQAANCIVRFTSGGHIFLFQNTWRHSHHEKNGLFISNGSNHQPLPPIAERLSLLESDLASMTVTRLSPVHDTTWTRHLFRLVEAVEVFVVIDRVDFLKTGPYAAVTTWRTPGAATFDNRRWTARQGAHRFTLISGRDGNLYSAEETDQGAANPTVLRQRRTGAFEEGSHIGFHQCFFVQQNDDGADLDFLAIDEDSAVLTYEGTKVAWFGVGLESAVLGGSIEVTAQSMLLRRCGFQAGAASRLVCPTLNLRVVTTEPVGMAYDCDSGVFHIVADGPEASPTVTLKIGETEETFVLDQSREIPIADQSEAFATECLDWIRNSGTMAGPLEELSRPAAPTGWNSLWSRVHGRTALERIRAISILADPLPIDGHPEQLIDTVLPEIRESWRQWPNGCDLHLQLELDPPQEIDHLRILGDSPNDPTLRTFCELPEQITLETTAPGSSTAVAIPVEQAPLASYKRFRDMNDALTARVATIQAPVKKIDLKLQAPADGRPTVLHEIEVRGSRKVPAPVTHCVTVDFAGDGQESIVFSTTDRSIHCWNGQGEEVWQLTVEADVTHISAHDLDGSGGPTLCVGIMGGKLLLVDAAGQIQDCWAIADAFNACSDAFIGWFNAIHTVAIWRRREDGRACLVAGGYAIVVFLDPDGKMIGHSWGDGPWITDILTVPSGFPGSGDHYARCGWNHGVFHYEGLDQDEPSGEHAIFGGARQPMFRMLRHVIPFVNGRTLCFSWVGSPAAEDGGILGATELGLGLLDNRLHDWRWKVEGGMALRACQPAMLSGNPVALTGGADGFITAYNLSDGQPHWLLPLGEPVSGIATDSNGAPFAVSTCNRLYRLDPDGQIQCQYPVEALSIRRFDRDQILVLRKDHQLELIAP